MLSKFNYPEPLKKDIGCKVSWYTYSNLDDAKKASEIAKEEMEHCLRLGYDFGYCSPSQIEDNKDGTYTVTLP